MRAIGSPPRERHHGRVLLSAHSEYRGVIWDRTGRGELWRDEAQHKDPEVAFRHMVTAADKIAASTGIDVDVYRFGRDVNPIRRAA